MKLETIKIKIEDHVAWMSINRPEKANALNEEFWSELHIAFDLIDENENVRVAVISGEGKHFCGGIDLASLMSVKQQNQVECEGRTRENIRKMVLRLQASLNRIAASPKPVIAAIHKGCIGAGLDLAACCDMRYASDDAFFTIKEIDMGMVADLGSLQRLPRLVGEGIVREWAYTGRHVPAVEAMNKGLVNEVYVSREEMMVQVGKLAANIAAKSPFAIRGTKAVLNHAVEHSVADGLEYVATWNGGLILSDDLTEAFQSVMMKKQPEFKN